MSRVYLGLGSNLEDPVRQIHLSLTALQADIDLQLLRRSGLYRSPALLKPGAATAQPDYVNAVAAIETTLTPHQLLYHCQLIEQQQGRLRGPQAWAPRTLDIDILVYDQITINDEQLIIPHPGLAERNFVLYPLFEIAPDLILPQHGPIAEVITHCDRAELTLIEAG